MSQEDLKHWELIGKYLKGILSNEESIHFKEWLNKNSENRQLIEEVEKIWKASLLPKEDYYPSVEKGLKEFRSRVGNKHTDNNSKKLASKDVSWVMKIAAGLVLVSGLIYLIYTLLLNQTVEYKTAANTYEILLPDSSIVWLNKNSSLKFKKGFNKNQREVFLSGEAFFEVKKAEGKRFTIFSNNSKTTVLGTSFNLRAYENEPKDELAVVTGKVSFSSTKTSRVIFLKPGDKGALVRKNNSLHHIKADKNESAWKTNKLIFDNTSLEKVLKTLENYFGTTLMVNNSHLLNCRFTGTFENPDLNNILEVLSVSVDLSFKQSENNYILSGTGCR